MCSCKVLYDSFWSKITWNQRFYRITLKHSIGINFTKYFSSDTKLFNSPHFVLQNGNGIIFPSFRFYVKSSFHSKLQQRKFFSPFFSYTYNTHCVNKQDIIPHKKNFVKSTLISPQKMNVRRACKKYRKIM